MLFDSVEEEVLAPEYVVSTPRAQGFRNGAASTRYGGPIASVFPERYGEFCPYNTFNVDQHPLPFASNYPCAQRVSTHSTCGSTKLALLASTSGRQHYG